MIRTLCLMFCLLILAGCKSEAPIITDEISPSGVHYTLIKMKSNDEVAVQLAWSTDWAYRDGLNESVPYVGKDLILAGGAEGYKPGEAGEKFADLKAEATINPMSDFVYGGLKFKKSNMIETLKIANAHLRAPTFDQKWLSRIAGDWKNRSIEGLEKPEAKLFNTMRWAILGNQPLRTSLSLDQPKDFEMIDRAQIMQWHKKVFTHQPKAVVVAGDLSSDEAGLIVDDLLAGLPAGSHTMDSKKKMDFKPRRILLHLSEAKTSQLLFIASIPPNHEGKEMEDILATSILGSGERSVLFKAVRTELRASYDFGAAIDNFSHNDRFMFMLGQVETTKLAETERAVRQAYSKFKQNGPNDDLALWKSLSYGPLESLWQTPDSAASAVIQVKINGQPSSRLNELRQEIDAVTLNSIKSRLASAYPASEGFVVVAISPDSSSLPDACVIRSPEEVVNCQ
jgi:zinc protease